MKEICVDLELAKELKENGFKQDSLFYHIIPCQSHGMIPDGVIWGKARAMSWNREKIYSAPTAEELLKELPEMIDVDVTYFLTMRKDRVSYRSLNNNILGTGQIHYKHKLCNALAKCWLYLKKNNLLEVI